MYNIEFFIIMVLFTVLRTLSEWFYSDSLRVSLESALNPSMVGCAAVAVATQIQQELSTAMTSISGMYLYA